MVHLIKAEETISVSENDDRIAAADRSAKFSGRCPRSIRGISRIVTDSSVLEFRTLHCRNRFMETAGQSHACLACSHDWRALKCGRCQKIGE